MHVIGALLSGEYFNVVNRTLGLYDVKKAIDILYLTSCWFETKRNLNNKFTTIAST